ncbi:hypothetical protein NQ318_004365 [Aromia moschata]|uniref:Uncharacterized protein n=1 Tax=Aromia moschata TaxID=1265417 RepID=A0AAV8YSV8_9CUCU|nr:hypothetical protein NQ318_004365 [Aromia moschata]
MIFVSNLEDIKSMCRICLTQSDDMIPMDHKIDDSEGSPFVSDILENIISEKISDDEKYPNEICNLCHGNMRILLDLKQLYTKSQRILKKHLYDENSHVSVIYEDDTDSQDKTITIKAEPEEYEAPSKVVKLLVNAKQHNDVKVTWLEGNKFVMERRESRPKIVLKHKCVSCHKRFSTKGDLNEHLKCCKKYVMFKCEVCDSKFSSLVRKQHHMRMKHTGKSSEIKCEVCDQVFKNHNAKSYHKLTRHNTEGKKFKCDICDKAFYIKNSLNQHLECHTRDVSKVVCPICGKSFHYRGGLFYHMKIHRNERNYICSFCEKRFLTMASLKRHTRIHTGERPYPCSLCSKTFCSVGEVKTHERRHLGQKPFQCKYCSKRFITPYNLKLHISSHTGTVPCTFCPKSFLNNEALKYHMDIKHNIREKKSDFDDLV